VALRNTKIGVEIRRTRESMRLTLVEFSARVGLPWQTLQAYETGRVVPPADRLFRILHATRRAALPFRVDYVARALAAA
jgi:DNA-binding transcriptional regulator YiaG